MRRFLFLLALLLPLVAAACQDQPEITSPVITGPAFVTFYTDN